MFNFKNEKGFTLVELMVVVLIIGILMAIAIPVFTNVTKTAAMNTCGASMTEVERGWEQLKATSATAPAEPASFAALVTAEATVIKATPKCPASGVYSSAFASSVLTVTCSKHGTITDLHVEGASS